MQIAGVPWTTAVEIAVRTARDFLDAETKPDFHPQIVFVVPAEEEAHELTRRVTSYFPFIFNLQTRLQKVKRTKKLNRVTKKRKRLPTLREEELEPAESDEKSAETEEPKTSKVTKQSEKSIEEEESEFDNGFYLYFISQIAFNLFCFLLLTIINQKESRHLISDVQRDGRR